MIPTVRTSLVTLVPFFRGGVELRHSGANRSGVRRQRRALRRARRHYEPHDPLRGLEATRGRRACAMLCPRRERARRVPRAAPAGGRLEPPVPQLGRRAARRRSRLRARARRTGLCGRQQQHGARCGCRARRDFRVRQPGRRDRLCVSTYFDYRAGRVACDRSVLRHAAPAIPITRAARPEGGKA